MLHTDPWTRTVPQVPGMYRLWDPDRGVNALVRVFCARGGRLAVENPCPCCSGLFLDMWMQPGFDRSRWLGPVRVPSALPAELERPRERRADDPDNQADRKVRPHRCLLGPHD